MNQNHLIVPKLSSKSVFYSSVHNRHSPCFTREYYIFSGLVRVFLFSRRKRCHVLLRLIIRGKLKAAVLFVTDSLLMSRFCHFVQSPSLCLVSLAVSDKHVITLSPFHPNESKRLLHRLEESRTLVSQHVSLLSLPPTISHSHPIQLSSILGSGSTTVFALVVCVSWLPLLSRFFPSL